MDFKHMNWDLMFVMTESIFASADHCSHRKTLGHTYSTMTLTDQLEAWIRIRGMHTNFVAVIKYLPTSSTFESADQNLIHTRYGILVRTYFSQPEQSSCLIASSKDQSLCGLLWRVPIFLWVLSLSMQSLQLKHKRSVKIDALGFTELTKNSQCTDLRDNMRSA